MKYCICCCILSIVVIIILLIYTLVTASNISINAFSTIDSLLDVKLQSIQLSESYSELNTITDPNGLQMNISVNLQDMLTSFMYIHFLSVTLLDRKEPIIGVTIQNYTISNGLQKLPIKIKTLNESIYILNSTELSMNVGIDVTYIPTSLRFIWSFNNIALDFTSNNNSSNASLAIDALPYVDLSMNKTEVSLSRERLFASVTFANQSFIDLPMNTKMDIRLNEYAFIEILTMESHYVACIVHTAPLFLLSRAGHLIVNMTWTPFFKSPIYIDVPYTPIIPSLLNVNKRIRNICDATNIFTLGDVHLQQQNIKVDYVLDLSKQTCLNVDEYIVNIDDVRIGLVWENVDFFEVIIHTDNVQIHVKNNEVMGRYITSLFESINVNVRFGSVIFALNFDFLLNIPSSMESPSINVFSFLDFFGIQLTENAIHVTTQWSFDFFTSTEWFTILEVQDILSLRCISNNNALQVDFYIYTVNASSWSFLVEQKIVNLNVTLLGLSGIPIDIPDRYTPLIGKLPLSSSGFTSNDVELTCKNSIYALLPNFKLDTISIEDASLHLSMILSTASCEDEQPILLGLLITDGYAIQFSTSNDVFASLTLSSKESTNSEITWPSNAYHFYDVDILFTIEDSEIFNKGLLQKIFLNNDSDVTINIVNVIDYTIILPGGLGEDLLLALFTSFFVSNDYIQTEVENGIRIEYGININLPDIVKTLLPKLTVGPYAWEVNTICLFSFSVENTLNINMKLDILYDDIYEKKVFYESFRTILTNDHIHRITVKSMPSEMSFDMILPASPEVLYCYFDDYIQTTIVSCEKGRVVCVNRFPFPVKVHLNRTSILECNEDHAGISTIDLSANQVKRIDGLYTMLCNQQEKSYHQYESVFICNDFHAEFGGITNIPMYMYYEKPEKIIYEVIEPTSAPTMYVDDTVDKNKSTLDFSALKETIDGYVEKANIGISIGLVFFILLLFGCVWWYIRKPLKEKKEN